MNKAFMPRSNWSSDRGSSATTVAEDPIASEAISTSLVHWERHTASLSKRKKRDYVLNAVSFVPSPAATLEQENH